MGVAAAATVAATTSISSSVVVVFLSRLSRAQSQVAPVCVLMSVLAVIGFETVITDRSMGPVGCGGVDIKVRRPVRSAFCREGLCVLRAMKDRGGSRERPVRHERVEARVYCIEESGNHIGTYSMAGSDWAGLSRLIKIDEPSVCSAGAGTSCRTCLRIKYMENGDHASPSLRLTRHIPYCTRAP